MIGFVVLILVVLALTAGAFVYTARAKREAEQTAAELDRLRRENPPPVLPELSEPPEPPEVPERE